MKDMHVKSIVISAFTIIFSGIMWLVIYSLNYKAAIGFDGPAGGILGMSILAGWIVSAIIAIIINRPFTKRVVFDTLLVVFVTGLFTGFVTGFIISNHALNHFPDGGTHIQ